MTRSLSYIIAAQLGYSVTSDGRVVNPHGKVLKTRADRGGYHYFSVRRVCKCRVHQLQAWQKFGEKMRGQGIEVRHLDNNPSNNSDENIAIGTKVENAADKSREVVMRAVLNAASYIRKHDHSSVIEFYKQTHSYRKTQRRFGITSLGTVHFIVNRSMASAAQPTEPELERYCREETV